MKKKFNLIPDIKLICILKSFFAKNCHFLINFIRGKWGQFGIIEPKTVHDLTLVEREINPVLCPISKTFTGLRDILQGLRIFFERNP